LRILAISTSTWQRVFDKARSLNVVNNFLWSLPMWFPVIICSWFQRYSQMNTKWDSNRLSCHQYVIRWLFTLTHLSVW
jgi:hypothetical protein